MKYPKDFWNERYGEKEYIYGRQPNQFFQEQLTALPPGRLLMPAEGEGRNAVFAARQGWEVSAFDQSEVGREKALKWAADNQVALDYQVVEAEQINYPENHFDAIGLIFAHFGPTHRAEIHRKLVTYLKPGGRIILEGYSKEQLDYQKKYDSGGPKSFDLLYSEAELRTQFDGLQVERLDTTEVTLAEGAYHNGLASIIRFIGRKG